MPATLILFTSILAKGQMGCITITCRCLIQTTLFVCSSVWISPRNARIKMLRFVKSPKCIWFIMNFLSFEAKSQHREHYVCETIKHVKWAIVVSQKLHLLSNAQVSVKRDRQETFKLSLKGDKDLIPLSWKHPQFCNFTYSKNPRWWQIEYI